MEINKHAYVITITLVIIISKVSCGDLWHERDDDEFADIGEDLSYKNHPCKRDCVVGKSMTCYYQFRVEYFYAFSKACYNCWNTTSDCFRKDCIVADGMPRPVTVVNRMMPGPTIEVCYGDTIVVDLVNMLPDAVTTIHWHGHHQMIAPYMDGVPMITQCPILPRTSFRYLIWGTNCGTHWWHSHVGSQRSDGMFGGFIVRYPKHVDPTKKLYQVDRHVIMINDWSTNTAPVAHLTDLLGTTTDTGDSMLINGMGPRWVNGSATTPSPIHRVNVTKGVCYRIRIIHAGSRLCPCEMFVDNHYFLVVSTDGENIKPVPAQSVVTTNGERYDMILCANQTVANYWIRFTFKGICAFKSIHQVAILSYEGAGDGNPEGLVTYGNYNITGVQVNPSNQFDNATNTVSVNDFCGDFDPCAPEPKNDRSLDEKVPCQHIIELNFNKPNHTQYHSIPYIYPKVNSTYQRVTPQFQNTSYKTPSVNLFTQWHQADKNLFCHNRNLTRCNGTNWCSCLYVIKVPLNCPTELVFIDIGTLGVSHPIHWHGYSAHVVASEKATKMDKETFIKLDKAGLVKRHLRKPCPPGRKDVMSVNSPGYIVVRFTANNPGLWFIHCHVEPHIEQGMAMVLQVGEPHEWVKAPRDFPKCHDYRPDAPRKKQVARRSAKETFYSVVRRIKRFLGSCE